MHFVKYAVAISLLAIAFFLGMIAMPRAEAQTSEVVVTYFPEVNSVCLSGKDWGICDHWWKFIEPSSTMSRQDAWNSIYGAIH